MPPTFDQVDDPNIKTKFVAVLVALTDAATLGDPEATGATLHTKFRLIKTDRQSYACPAKPDNGRSEHWWTVEHFRVGPGFWFRALPSGYQIPDLPYGPRHVHDPEAGYDISKSHICNGNEPDFVSNEYKLWFDNLQAFACFSREDMEEKFHQFKLNFGTDFVYNATYYRQFGKVRVSASFNFYYPGTCALAASVTEDISDTPMF